MNIQANRILSITFHNIKTIRNGKVESSDIYNTSRARFEPLTPSILGIYGQNGSGKTTVVESLYLLKSLSFGLGLLKEDEKKTKALLPFLLPVGEANGSIEYEFLIYAKGQPYIVNYLLELKRIDDEISAIKKETLSAKILNEDESSLTTAFAPISFNYGDPALLDLYDGIKHEKPKIDFAINSDDFFRFTTLSATKKFCIKNSSSMIFSSDFLNYLSKGKTKKIETAYDVLKALQAQINFELFVYTHKNEVYSHLGLDTIFVVYKTKKSETHGAFYLSDKPFTIEEKDRPLYDQFIKEVNLFIGSFIPGFDIHIVDNQSFTDENGNKMQTISIYRKEKMGDLPLSQESSGIKKIFNISVALIYAYGNPNCWLVVDELDSGVFEDLLGKILQAINESGKGQLLFTAHNLVPLERLSYKSIIFTTSNPDNRYVRFHRTSNTSNLRSLYYRALALNGQKEKLGSSISVEDIEQVFYEAYWSLSELKQKVA